jgi:hypothetical protein
MGFPVMEDLEFGRGRSRESGWPSAKREMNYLAHERALESELRPFDRNGQLGTLSNRAP